jgi:hypothetical protein
MRTWPAAANDDFSDPPGMDARRARSDRDNFVWNKIEQPQAGPKGERQDAWSLCTGAWSEKPIE